MTGFDLPTNFTEDPESLLRRTRARLTPPRKETRPIEPVIPAPSSSEQMADKTLREFSAPSAANIPTGPAGNVGDANFEIKTGLITMVQASPFCGKANEDASAHLQQFLEICNTFKKKDSLITFMKNFLEKEKVAQQQLMKARRQRSHIKQQPPKSTRQQPPRSAKKQAVKPAKPQPPKPEKPPTATKTKKVWRVKQEASSVSSSPGPDNASSS